MSNYTYLSTAATSLKWACNYLLYHLFSMRYDQKIHDQLPEVAEYQLRTGQYKQNPAGGSGGEESAECAVCLSKIEDEDEIGELMCHHLFHKVCLDRWIGYKNPTCPLCRGYLGSFRTISELGFEVLSFTKFSAFGSRERETWWLR